MCMVFVFVFIVAEELILEKKIEGLKNRTEIVNSFSCILFLVQADGYSANFKSFASDYLHPRDLLL